LIGSPGVNPEPAAVTKAPTHGPGSKTASSAGAVGDGVVELVTDVAVVSVLGVVSVVSVLGVVSVVSVLGVVSVVSVLGVVSEVGVVSVVSVLGVVAAVGLVAEVVLVVLLGVVSELGVLDVEPYGSVVGACAKATPGVINAAATNATDNAVDSRILRVLPSRCSPAAFRTFTMLRSMT
jgi:hypothetical protein